MALPRFFAASSPGASHLSITEPTHRAAFGPELSSMTFFRSGGRPWYFALFMAKKKNET